MAGDAQAQSDAELKRVEEGSEFAPPPRIASNKPSYCTGWSALRVLTLPMLAITLGLFALTYYPYMLSPISPATTFERVVFHCLIGLALASYSQCVLVDPGTVPPEWREWVANAPPHVQNTFKKCRVTKQRKPPRSHYCSVTRRLVLNMDHFCPWVVNTVGFHNRKFFIQFVVYTALACGCKGVLAHGVHSTEGEEEEDGFHGTRLLVFMAFIVDVVFFLALASFGWLHLDMALHNQTSIEVSGHKQYDVGARRNLEQVFGVDAWAWALPIYHNGPSEDGVNWPTRNDEQEHLLE